MKRLTATLLVACFATSAMAQNTATPDGSSSAATPQPSIWDSSDVARGFRIGLTVPNMDLKTKASAIGISQSVKEDANADFGYAIGYANIGINRIGGIGSLAYTSFEDGDAAAMRLEGSATYGFNKYVYVLGGLNINKIVEGSEVYVDLDPALGFQIGVGIQATPNIGFDIKHVTTKNEGDYLGVVDVEAELSGLELGVNATF